MPPGDRANGLLRVIIKEPLTSNVAVIGVAHRADIAREKIKITSAQGQQLSLCARCWTPRGGPLFDTLQPVGGAFFKRDC